MKRLTVIQNLVQKIQNLVVNHESRPVKTKVASSKLGQIAQCYSSIREETLELLLYIYLIMERSLLGRYFKTRPNSTVLPAHVRPHGSKTIDVF